MKLKIMQGINPYDNNNIFRVYEFETPSWCPDGRWIYRSSFGTLEQARDFMVIRAKTAALPAETLVEEFEG